MYFFYFDESGSRDPKAFENKPDGGVQIKDHIYSLTTIGLWEGHWFISARADRNWMA
jgi:hypothetical protein